MPQPKKAQPQYLSVEEILAADDLKEADVNTPEWGGKVRVRALSRRAVLDLVEECRDADDLFDEAKAALLWVVRGVVNPPLTEDRVEQLNSKHATPLRMIVAKVKELSGVADPNDEAMLLEEGVARFPG